MCVDHTRLHAKPTSDTRWFSVAALPCDLTAELARKGIDQPAAEPGIGPSRSSRGRSIIWCSPNPTTMQHASPNNMHFSRQEHGACGISIGDA